MKNNPIIQKVGNNIIKAESFEKSNQMSIIKKNFTRITLSEISVSVEK